MFAHFQTNSPLSGIPLDPADGPEFIPNPIASFSADDIPLLEIVQDLVGNEGRSLANSAQSVNLSRI